MIRGGNGKLKGRRNHRSAWRQAEKAYRAQFTYYSYTEGHEVLANGMVLRWSNESMSPHPFLLGY